MKSAAIVLILFALFLSCPPAGAEEARTGTFDSAGVSISYLVAGSGEPVVLIHGLHSSAEMNWQMPGTVKVLERTVEFVAGALRRRR